MRLTPDSHKAIVRYKEDLRLALDAARKAEKAAKNAGRDTLQVTVCRRLGEYASALRPWDFADQNVAPWVQMFRKNASDRWAYHLHAELETIEMLDVAVMRAS